jgi:hypothetical protein
MWNYIVISVLLAVLFEMGGIQVTDTLVGYFGLSLSDGAGGMMSEGTFWNFIFNSTTGILVAVGISALAVGFLTKSNPENYLVLAIIIAGSATFLATFVGVIGAARAIDSTGWIYYLSLLLMGPLLVGYVVSMIDYFRGNG